MDEQGRPIPAEQAEAAAPFLAAKQAQSRLGPNDFLYYREGVPETWRIVDGNLAEIMRMGWPKEANPVAELLSLPAKVARTGIVASPMFWVRVGIHSNLAASAFGDGVGSPGHVMGKGLMSAFKLDEHYDAWVRHGGAGTAISDFDRDFVAKDYAKAFAESGTDDAVWNTVQHPIEAMRDLQHMIDAAPRIGLMRKLQESGMDPTKAAMRSRSTFFDHAEDFSGSWVNTWARMSPFFNAAFKDVDQVVRAMKERPGTTMALAGSIMTLPTILNYAANMAADQSLPEDQKYHNLPEWERRMFWITPPVNGVRMKVKAPYVGAYFFKTVPEMFMDWAATGDRKESFKGALGTFFDQATPKDVAVPTIAQPMVEQYANKAFGRPLVPASMEKASGYMQYKPDTSLMARKLAGVIGPANLNIADASPIVIENYARDWLGSVPMNIAKALEQPFRDPGRPPQAADNPFWGSFFVRNNVGGQAVEDFYDKSKEFEARHRDLALAIKRRDMSEIKDASVVQAGVKLNDFQKAIGNMNAALDAVNKSAMTNDEKTKRTDQISNGMVVTAKAATKLMRDIDTFKNGGVPTP